MAKILKDGEIEQILKVLQDPKTIDGIISRRESLLAELNTRTKRAQSIIVTANKLLKNGIGELQLRDFFKKSENGGWFLEVKQEDCTKQYLDTRYLNYRGFGYRGIEEIGYFSLDQKGYRTCRYRNVLTNEQMEKMIEAFDVFEDCFFSKVKQILAEES